MAVDTKTSGLPAVASVSAAQEFPVNDGGVSRRATAAQIATYVTGSLTELTVDNIRLDGHQVQDTGAGATDMFIVNGTSCYIDLRGSSGQVWFRNDVSGLSVLVSMASGGATSVNLGPNASDPDTGIGRAASDQLSLIAGGVEGLRQTAARTIVQKLLSLTKTSSTAAASATEYPNSGDCGIHHNTSLGTRHLAFNDGGTIFTVQLV